MNLYEEIKAYKPYNEEEERDKELILNFMDKNPDCLSRDNLVAHLTVSAWTVNKEMNKVLMVYHNIYNSWSWVGGHADGDDDLKRVTLKELSEETGVTSGYLYSDEIFSLESLTVDGHYKKGKYVPSHLHLNITYLVIADEEETIRVKEDENKGVAWFNLEEALKKPNEKWFVEHIYSKLVKKVKDINIKKLK